MNLVSIKPHPSIATAEDIADFLVDEYQRVGAIENPLINAEIEVLEASHLMIQTAEALGIAIQYDGVPLDPTKTMLALTPSRADREREAAEEITRLRVELGRAEKRLDSLLELLSEAIAQYRPDDGELCGCMCIGSHPSPCEWPECR